MAISGARWGFMALNGFIHESYRVHTTLGMLQLEYK